MLEDDNDPPGEFSRKYCPVCHQGIPAAAIWCPFCTRAQTPWARWLPDVLLVLLGAGLVALWRWR
jgi:hypothetical protein